MMKLIPQKHKFPQARKVSGWERSKRFYKLFPNYPVVQTTADRVTNASAGVSIIQRVRRQRKRNRYLGLLALLLTLLLTGWLVKLASEVDPDFHKTLGSNEFIRDTNQPY